MRICPICQQTYDASTTADGLCPSEVCRAQLGILRKGIGRVVNGLRRKKKRKGGDE